MAVLIVLTVGLWLIIANSRHVGYEMIEESSAVFRKQGTGVALYGSTGLSCEWIAWGTWCGGCLVWHGSNRVWGGGPFPPLGDNGGPADGNNESSTKTHPTPTKENLLDRVKTQLITNLTRRAPRLLRRGAA